MLRNFALALSFGTLALAMTACNTVRGAAQDVEFVANEVDEEI